MPPSHVPAVLLLEHPRPQDPSRFQEVVNAPLSACLFSPYLLSFLHLKGVEAELLDTHLSGLSMQETLAELNKRNFSLLGVHLVYLWEKTEEVFNLLTRFRSLNPQVHINLFGFYPTFAFKEILERFPFVDSIALGEPEEPFLKLAQTLKDSNGLSDLSSIERLAIRKDGNIISIQKKGYIGLDSLPFPDRSTLSFYKEKGLFTYILGSRGCYGRCTFCYVGPFYGEWRGRSPENIFGEMQDLYAKGVRYFYFADVNFFGPGRAGKERAGKLAEIILKEKLDIRFGMECRANDLEKDSLSKLVKAGLREVFLGVESACNHVLQKFKKDISQEVNARAIRLLRLFGIEPNMGFIMFEPHSKFEDIRTNFEFLKANKLLRTPAITAHLLSHKQTLFQGTCDYNKFKNCIHTYSFTKYEAHYDFEDQRVGSFHEVAIQLCQGILSLLEPAEAQACCSPAQKKDNLTRINKILIESYEKTLHLYEEGVSHKRVLNHLDKVTKEAAVLHREKRA